MSAFIGEYSCKADSKYRVVVPASFRRDMVSSQEMFFVLRKNVFDACIDLYPHRVWEEMVVKLRTALNPFDRKHATFLREFHRGTQEVEMDTNGRILLPKRMLEDIGVDKEMIFAAQDSIIQIWNPQTYEAMAMDGDTFGTMAEEVFRNSKV